MHPSEQGAKNLIRFKFFFCRNSYTMTLKQMKPLLTKTNKFQFTRLLSSNYPFLVYDAFDISGRHVVVKKLFEPEDTLSNLINTYAMFHGFDLMTSIWYGHLKATINQIKGDVLLIKQYQYLYNSCLEYNLANCILDYDLNDKPILAYDFVQGDTFQNLKIDLKSDLFLRMISSLMEAVSHYPHGDLSFTNLILHEDHNKFSIIDPAIRVDNIFFTNTEYYPLVPPLFSQPKKRYTTYADQLAIGLMLYKLLTQINPLKNMSASPFWAKEHGFGNGVGGRVPDDIYSVISILPDSWGGLFGFNEYLDAIRNQLKIQCHIIPKQKSDFIQMTGINNDHIDFPSEFFNIKSPKQINYAISTELSDFCMSLIFNYEPIDFYIDKLQQLTAHSRH